MHPTLPPRLALPTVLTVLALAAVTAVLAMDLGTIPALAALGVALAGSLWTLVAVRRQILSPMVGLATHLTGAQADPAEVDLLRHRGDAIGAIATVLLDHQARVQQLTAEQAVLADGLAMTMTDLARRSLTLVNRLVAQTAAMQQDETDAARLDGLRTLNHLAGRLRGQSQNLLVVADTAPAGDPDAPPMRMADVVELAASHTEDPSRVRVDATAPVAVLGWASQPLAQMLTALLDNGVRYSPPDEPVVVTSRQRPDGVVVEIRDHGIGMDDAALQAAHHVLDTPPLLQAAQSHQLGLYVTGVLSRRLGAWVRLARPAEDQRGIIASVGIPAAVLALAPTQATGTDPGDRWPGDRSDDRPDAHGTRAAEARRLAAAAVLLPTRDDDAVAGLSGMAGAVADASGTPAAPPAPPKPVRRERRRKQTVSSWSIAFPGQGQPDDGDEDGSGLTAFVNDAHTAADKDTATSPGPTSLPERPLFVAAPRYTPPSLSEPADYIPDLVDNPLLDILPEHPTAQVSPVVPVADVRPAVDLPAVLDGIRMADPGADEARTPPPLPTRGARSDADVRPVTRLFADLEDRDADDDSQFTALAGLVAGDLQGPS